MKQKLYLYFYKARYFALYVFLFIAVLMMLWLYGFGVFNSETLPAGFSSRIQLLGLLLMLIILPAYLSAAMVFGQRRSLQLAQKAEEKGAYKFAEKIKVPPLSFLLCGAAFGVIYSMFNLPDVEINTSIVNNKVYFALASSQILLWLLVGLTLATRFYVAREFYLAGRKVHIDLFEMSNLKPFGLSGLKDALVIVVGLALTTLQSLDAQFRLNNYLQAFAVILPAMGILMVLPMYCLLAVMLGSIR